MAPYEFQWPDEPDTALPTMLCVARTQVIAPHELLGLWCPAKLLLKATLVFFCGTTGKVDTLPESGRICPIAVTGDQSCLRNIWPSQPIMALPLKTSFDLVLLSTSTNAFGA